MAIKSYSRKDAATVLDLHPRHRSTLAGNELFHGIREADLMSVLTHLNAHIEHYEKGEVIVPLDSEVKAGVILDGQARVSYYDEDLSSMAVDHLHPGYTFGQMAACLDGYRSQIELVAVAYTIVCRIDLRSLLTGGVTTLPSHHHVTISTNVIKSVSEHAAMLHLRLRIIGQKTVRNRLKVYLNHLFQDRQEHVHIPFSMSDLAAFLNSDRSALYKEIRLLKQEGILDWRRRKVRLYKHDF